MQNVNSVYSDDEDLNPYARFQTQADLDLYNNNQKETIVRLIGDSRIIAQTVQLLAYIRHALSNNAQVNLEVSICNTVANPTFMMDVNGMQIPDLVTQKKIQIN